MSKSIERNITLKDQGVYRYKVVISRKRKEIIESHSSLEEAIIARDEIESYYNSHQILKNSSLYEDRRYSQAKQRFKNANIIKVNGSKSDRYAVKCQCSKCKADVQFKDVHFYNKFLERNSICDTCDKAARTKKIAKIISEKDQPFASNLSTGVKNICYDSSSNDYKVSVMRGGKRISLRTKTLKSAKSLKTRVLNFYSDFGRLPTLKEI